MRNDPRVAEAMRLHKISTRSHHVWQTLRALGEQDERAQAAIDDHTRLLAYLAAEFDKVPSAPVEAVPDSRQNCRNLTVGKDGECVHCYAKAGQECQYEPASDDALSDRYIEQRNEIARLTAELTDEKAVVDVLRSELQDRLQKQRAAEAELQEVRTDADRYRWLREQAWFAGPLCVLRDPKDILTRGAFLGADCPSLSRLDDAIDAAMTKEKPHG